MNFPRVETIGNKKRIYYWNGIVEYTPIPAPDGSETSLEALNPLFRPLAEQLIAELKKRLPGYKIQINNTFRTKEEQIQLRKTSKYASRVSPHCFGLAIDISIIDNKGQAVTKEEQIQKKLDDAASKIGIYWGGWFSTVKEPWHFQIALNWQASVKS